MIIEPRVGQFCSEIILAISAQIALNSVQLPLYYIQFEIAQLQDLVSSIILLMQY